MEYACGHCQGPSFWNHVDKIESPEIIKTTIEEISLPTAFKSVLSSFKKGAYMKKYDVIIVGAGVIGCAIARELSRYQLQVAVLEKENDVSCGASKANSGIVHGGFDAKAGTNKGYFSRRGNRMYAKLNEELNFGYLECGSLVLAYDDQEYETLLRLKENGEKTESMIFRFLTMKRLLRWNHMCLQR